MAAMTYRVLIVDDSPEDRFAFRRYLANCVHPAYIVAEATSGEDGMAQCRIQIPDCILLDYNLPDVNGVEFLSRLRADFGGNQPAVVMLTGQGNETLAVQAMKAGAQDYLVKGMTQNRVGQAVPAAIESVRLRRTVDTQALEVQRLSEERAKLITELEQRATELAETDRRKDEFLATLAHELRNPLAPIRAAMHILKQMYPGANTVTELRGVVERQINHLTRLIDDLMDVARITSGKVALQRERIALDTVILQAVEICQPLFEASGHKIDVSYPTEAVLLDADPVRLVQILANILANACKYTIQPGLIFLKAQVEKENVIFVISDPGIGMEAASLSKIFATFAQIHSTPGHAQNGLGIGLSLAKQFAEMHGGTISPDSGGLSKGSKFVVTLPVVVTSNDPSGSAVAPEVKDRPAIIAGNRQILVVDDNADAANMLQLLFETDGFTVLTAYNGEEAVKIANKCKPHILVMDLGMPGIDGYQAVRLIRQQPGGADILAIALTGWNQADIKQRTQDAGFDHHVVKPVNYDDLKHLLTESRR